MSKVTRVLLLSPPLDMRGTTVHTRNLIRALKNRDYEFHLVAQPGTLRKAVIDEGTIFHPFPLVQGISTWLNLPRLAKLVYRIDPHIIHARHHTLLKLAGPLLWGHPLPVVASVSTPPAPGPLPMPKGNTRAILAVSDPLAEELVASHRVPRSLLTIVQDATFVSVEPTPPLDGTAPVVGFMGRIEKDRGVEQIPGIAKRVLKEMPHVRFAVVGEGRDEIPLRRWIRKSGLADRVFIGPPPTDYRKILQSFHIFLSPAVKEGLGIFSLEAMAVGRPVIATAVGGVYGHVKDDKTGLLVTPGDEEDMAAKIVKLLANPDIAHRLGQGGWELVRKKFSLEKFGREMDLAYKRAKAFLPKGSD